MYLYGLLFLLSVPMATPRLLRTHQVTCSIDKKFHCGVDGVCEVLSGRFAGVKFTEGWREAMNDYVTVRPEEHVAPSTLQRKNHRN